MSQLQTLDLGIELPKAKLDDALAQSVLKTGDYLPYISIMGSNSNAVKEEKCAMGVIALVANQTPIDLGKEVVMVVIAERAKAMRFGDAILSYFDATSAEFKKVQQDAGMPNSGAMAGLEFLVWLPNLGETGTFAGLFCGSKSMKKEAATIRSFVGGKAMTLKIALAANAKYKWHTGTAVPHSAPIGTRPDPEELREELQKFCNPESSKVEKAEPAAVGGRAR